MTSKTLASILTLLLILSGIALTKATSENNYKNDTNPLPNISESTHTENGYKANILINPYTLGIYAKENGYKIDLTINPTGIGGTHTENNYQLDLIPEKTFPDVTDVAVTNIVTSKTVVGQGYSMRINITVSNQGLNYETLYVTVKANTTAIKIQNITLTSIKSTTLSFTWNTAGFARGNYTISAYAEPVPGETDKTDNTVVDGFVWVGLLGDFTGLGYPTITPPDDAVNINDIRCFVDAYRSQYGIPPPPGVDPANCDLCGPGYPTITPPDGVININDIRLFVDAYIDYWTP